VASDAVITTRQLGFGGRCQCAPPVSLPFDLLRMDSGGLLGVVGRAAGHALSRSLCEVSLRLRGDVLFTILRLTTRFPITPFTRETTLKIITMAGV
jgi:hypothetical protein